SGNGQHHFAAYTAKVRITVRAGDIIIVREGSGTGEGSGLTPVRRTKSPLRARRPMLPSERSPHSATPLGLPSTIASSSEYANAGTSGPDPHWARGWYARTREPSA